VVVVVGRPCIGCASAHEEELGSQQARHYEQLEGELAGYKAALKSALKIAVEARSEGYRYGCKGR
jgi:hypothetical protein